MSKNQSSLTLKSILFKKYLILSKIDEGSFGSIYLSKNIITNEKVAIKIESRKITNPLLEREAYILFYLRGPGLPEIKTFGRTKDFFILIQSLLGPSLSNLLDKYLINFTIKDICLLSIQMIERLEYIHSKSYIHRDIKPQNFLMGIKDIDTVYLIDFGLAKKFRSKKGKHIKFNINNNITGTPRYCSINALRGAEQSRRDDLESCFYVIIYFFRGNLPWQNLKIKSRQERFNKIKEIKKNVNYKILCKNLPEELYNFGMYIKHLKFEEDPDYNFMRKCFYSILKKINEKNDNNFSWLNQINNISKSNNISSSNTDSKKNILSYPNISRQRNSSHKRLYEKISSSLEKKNVQKTQENIIINKKILAQTSNVTKDNITLKSFNIEKNNGNINRSNSYVINPITNKINLKKNNSSLINKIMNKYISIKNNNSNRNASNEIKKHKTQFYNNELKSKLFLGDDSNYFSDIVKYSSNFNESLKNIFLRNSKIIYTSPNLVADLKRKENSFKNVKKVVINIENKNSIKNRNDKIKGVKNNLSINSVNNNKISNLKNINNKKMININKYLVNSRSYKNNLSIKGNNNINNKKINIKNTHIKSSANIINENKKIRRNNAIKRTNTGTILRLDNKSPIYNTSNSRLDIKYNPINLSNIEYFKNRNINLNIKLINNNNYNNILLKNSKDKTKKLNNKKINLDTNKNVKQNNINRIIKYKTHRKISTSANNFNLNEFKYGVEENLQNKIKIMNIPDQKNKLDKKFMFNKSHFLIK